MTRILTGKARGVQGWFQKWYLVDPDRQKQELTGILDLIGQ